jgi:UDP-N-acetylglucosamine 2-epimerase (non-hydrolysing)
LKILLCFGTRPEAIKMVPIIQELINKGLDYKVCVTAQHRQMLDQVLVFFGIIPHYDLDIMTSGQELNALSALILEKLDNVIKLENPDIILVQGDTTTAFLSAFAGFNRGIKVGHVEAGLRTWDLQFPFPEEANRQLIARITDFHFTPTPKATQNLENEKIKSEKIFFTGNTVIDALEIGKKKLKTGYTNDEILKFQRFLKKEQNLVLVTGHRRENFGKGLEQICQAIIDIANLDRTQVIFPVHMNPIVSNSVKKMLQAHPDILLTEPVNYPAFLWLMSRCDLIISDSGGVQEEAPSFTKKVLVTRETTERPEGLENGFSILTGNSKKKILEESKKILSKPQEINKIENPYGDGKAAQRIVQILVDSL